MPRDRRLYMTFPNDFWTHPKVARLSDAAFRAFVEANGHSRMRETDGLIEKEDAEFMWSETALDELLVSHPTRPLVVREGENYLIRDYAEHQLTKADREELIEKRAAAGRASAEKRRALAEHVLNTSEQTATEREIEREIEVKNKNSSSEIADAITRPEIEHLLNLLDAEIRNNGGKPPTRTKRNADATRLLLDKDGHTVEQIERAIRWCQADEFWRANILSMSKLREKYDQLRLAASRTPGGVKQSKAAQNAAAYRRLVDGHEGSVPALDVGVSAGWSNG